jgi:hypothetical protein
MSYAPSAALQTALYAHLSSAALDAPIYDAIPPGTAPDTYILLGPEEVIDRSDITARGAEHRLTIAVVTSATGFLAAKTLAAAICDRLEQPLPALTRGHLVALWFDRAEARRTENGRTRRIDLRFRARIEDSPLPTP